MSVKPLIIPAKKLAVEISSVWDHNLDWMVENAPKANPNEMLNIGAKRGTKHAEINQATKYGKVFSEDKVSNPVELKAYYEKNGRPDGFKVTEIKGTPYEIGNVGYAPDTEQHWTDLLAQEGYVTRDYDHGALNIDNIDSYIQRQQLQVNDAAAARDEVREGVHMGYIEEAEELKASLQTQDAVRNHNTDNFNTLHREWEDVMGFDDDEAVHVDKIDNALDRLYNRQAEVEGFLEERWDPDYSEELEKLLDSSESLENLKTRLTDLNNTDVRVMRGQFNGLIDQFGVRWDSEPDLENIDDYVDAIRTQVNDGTLEFGSAENFEDLLDLQSRYHELNIVPHTETMDLTRTTQEFVDNAGQEFERIANEVGIAAPNPNNPDEVANFFREANLEGQGQTDLNHLGQLEQSYNNLRVRVEAGEETITIPDYNTRQVQGNVRYDFGPDAFREATMPDTDDATYMIRGYDDPTIDRKGFDRDVHSWGGQFFTRTDSPHYGVLRIQEIQSDIANQMNTARNEAITQWQKAPTVQDMPIEVVGRKMALSNSYLPDDPRVMKLRKRVVDKTIEELNTTTSYKLEGDFSDASIQELKEAYIDALAMPLVSTDGSGLSKEAMAFFTELRGSTVNQYLEIPLDIKEKIFYNSELSMLQIEDIVSTIKDLRYTYEDHLIRERGEMLLDLQDAAKYRVTPEERYNRIVAGRGVSKEEGELNANTVKETISDINAKYGTDLKPYAGAQNIEDLRMNIVDTYIPKEEIRAAVKYSKTLYNDGTAEARAYEYYFSEAGYKQAKKEHPDIPDLPAMALDVDDIFDAKLATGMKELTPLEKFPDAAKFRLDLQWQKQAMQEEIVRAIKNGQTEVWLTMDPDGVEKIGRGVRPHSQYMPPVTGADGKVTGGFMYSKFKSLAKKFHADIVEEDGYLKMKLPTGKKVAAVTGGTGILPIMAFADTDREQMRDELVAEGYSPSEAEALLDEAWKADQDDAAADQDLRDAGYNQEEIDSLFHEAFIREMDPADFATHEGVRSDDMKTPEMSPYQVQTDVTQRGPSYKTLTPDTIKDIAIELEVDPSTPSGIDAIYQEAYWKENPEEYAEFQAEIDAERLSLDEITGEVADYINLRDSWSIFSFVAKGFGNNMAAAWRTEVDKDLTEFIVNKGAENDLELQKGRGQKIGEQTLATDEWYVKLPHPETGELLWWPATPSTMQSIAGEKYMDVGGIIGGLHGMNQASNMTRWVNGLPVPAAKYVKIGVIGGWTMAGAVTGSLIDQLEVDIRQEEDFNWKTTADRAIGAAELSIVGDVIGVSVGALGGATAKQLIKAYNIAIDGNVNGAFDILKKMTNLTEVEIKEIIAKWEHLNGPVPMLERRWYSPRKYIKSAAKKEKERAIQVIPYTNFGGEEVVKGITNKNPGAGAIIGNNIHDRAQMLGKIVEDNMGMFGAAQTVEELLESIPRWVNETEANLAFVKQAGNDLTPAGYSSGAAAKAKTLPQFKNKIKKPKYEAGYGFHMKEDYINQLYDGTVPGVDNLPIAKKLEKIARESDDRSFVGLLDFRDKVQEYYTNPTIAKHTRETLGVMLENIDGEIKAVSERMGPEGEQWLQNYQGALADQLEMRELQKTGLYRTLTRKEGSDYYLSGLNEEKVANTLIKYGRSLDGSYQAFVKQLPLPLQPKVEALVMNKLVEKYTFQKGLGFEAIQFPQLAEELGDFEFIWPEAKAIREMTEMFADVYKNDVKLSIAARQTITEDAFTSYLTTNPIVRLQFAMASTIFNKASTLAGTSRGDASALVRIAAKFMKEPLDPTSVKEVLEVAKNDAALAGAINRMSAQTAADKAAGRVDVKIPLFKTKDGKLTAKGGKGRTKTAESLPAHRVTNEAVVREILGKNANLSNLSKLDKAKLINRDYVAIGLGDGTIIKLN